ncbi:MAG: alpha-glucosidase/alpha-galactosidase [Acidobacteriota bacterium]|jgi:alpha-galactosidase|nr:alpha-glucosidase/alpha-galactosidase [Acidobacteriota bacterium]
MPIKVAVIGAGSIGFTRAQVRDILCIPELRDTEFAFTDINERNLDMVYQLCKRDIEASGLPAKVSATLDRREAFKDANYVYSFVRVGGLEGFQTDIDIPLKYGVDQCVGDTLAPGGIMYAQRTIPVLLGVCKDISEVAAPGCTLINHSNPMSMNTWACYKYGYGVNVIGLCHGVEGGHHQIANVLGLPVSEVDIICAGLNHQTWYISVKHKGQDMTGKLLEAFEKHETYSKTEKVRIEMLRRFGYYCTESNGHFSEYVPWFRKRADDLVNWIDLGSWINGETGGYLRVCTEGRNWFEHDFPNWMQADPWTFEPEKRGHEHGSYIVEGLETGRRYRGHFNVQNHGCITNLPPDCCVEVPGYVDGNGLSIPIVGDLPLGCAAICNASVSVQRLAVEAAVHGDDFLLRQAMMLDGLTGAVLNPPEISQMTDEMLVAGEQWLPQYADAIEAAKKRLASGNLIPTREGYKGAARLHTKTVEEMAADREAARKLAEEADKAKERPAAEG